MGIDSFFLPVIVPAFDDSRAKVKEAMGFALDHADASEDVVVVLKESLLVKETPIHGEDRSQLCARLRWVSSLVSKCNSWRE